ncbi:hypothetical protein ACFE04_006696 [Oxalis oulophora]
MGNAAAREDVDGVVRNPSGSPNVVDDVDAPDDVVPMTNTPPQSPTRSRSPHLFAPQLPIAPIQKLQGSRLNDSSQPLVNDDVSTQEKGVPTIISWTFGGHNVAVQGSWDNWKTRKLLQRSGKDHSVLLVLPPGIYHYKFIVDGESKYIPDLPSIADGAGHICNLLDVDDYVPEILDSVAEFEAPPSPESSYSQSFPTEDDFAKEPAALPPQFHLAALGKENNNETSPPSKPRHVMINHLYMEKGCDTPSVVALGLTHRFQSKYVTVVLYKPQRKR